MATCSVCGGKTGVLKSECNDCKAKAQAAERAREEQRRQQEAQAQSERWLAEQRLREEQERARTAAATERREKDDSAKAEQERAKKARLDKHVEESLQALERLIADGLTPYLYRQVTIETVSTVDDRRVGAPPDLSELQKLGFEGWEIVTTVPVTLGMRLKNSYVGGPPGRELEMRLLDAYPRPGYTQQEGGLSTWAGGIGGMVVGAVVLLRLPLTPSHLKSKRPEIIAELTRSFPG